MCNMFSIFKKKVVAPIISAEDSDSESEMENVNVPNFAEDSDSESDSVVVEDSDSDFISSLVDDSDSDSVVAEDSDPEITLPIEDDSESDSDKDADVIDVISDEKKNIITLSFDDKSIKPHRFDKRTIVKMRSYFRSDKIQKFINYFGFEEIPDAMKNILKSYGYHYDYKLNGWVTNTIGIATLDPRDGDEQIKANHIAVTKSKVKAYDRAQRCLYRIANLFFNVAELFERSNNELVHYLDDECAALDRVIETGYCNPNMK